MRKWEISYENQLTIQKTMSIETLMYANMPTFRHRKQRFKQKNKYTIKKLSIKDENQEKMSIFAI